MTRADSPTARWIDSTKHKSMRLHTSRGSSTCIHALIHAYMCMYTNICNMDIYMCIYIYERRSIFLFLEMVSSRIIVFVSRDFRPHFRATCLRWWW